MVRPIVRDPVFLGRKSENAGPEDLPIGNDLLDTLNAHAAECVGMAANMIGKAKRIIVFSGEHGAELMFNPEIIRKEDSYETEEGCLSLPGTRRTVRYRKIKNPPAEAVIVAKSDRMARDIKLYYYFMMLLEKRGMKLVSATEEVVNDDTGLGNVYKALMLFVAEQERNNITKRTSGGRAVKSANGGYSGGRTPFGYKAENHQMVIDPEEAETVREIFRLKDGEGFTYQAVAEALNREGKVNRSGKPFIISTIQTIYENKKVYQGMYRYGKRSNKDAEWVPGQHEAILKEG